MWKTERKRDDIFRVMDEEMVKGIHHDPCSRAILLPKRIIWTDGEVKNSEALLEEREFQISLGAHNPCIMKSTKKKVRNYLKKIKLRLKEVV